MLSNFTSKCARCTNNNSTLTRYLHTAIKGCVPQCAPQHRLTHLRRLVPLGATQSQSHRNYSAHFTYVPDTVPSSEGETARMNLFQAVNNAMDIALASDPTASN